MSKYEMMPATTTSATSPATSTTCGYTHLPALAASDVWSVDETLKSILAPCEVWEEKGAFYFRTFHGETAGPFESELLACKCAAIVRNPSLQFPPRAAQSFGWLDWQTRALLHTACERSCSKSCCGGGACCE